MCVYCVAGDFYDKWWPITPAPMPANPWPMQPFQPLQPPRVPEKQEIERLKEFLDVLQKIKALEDQLGCPCETPEDRGKPDYLKKLSDRIAELEKKVT